MQKKQEPNPYVLWCTFLFVSSIRYKKSLIYWALYFERKKHKDWHIIYNIHTTGHLKFQFHHLSIKTKFMDLRFNLHRSQIIKPSHIAIRKNYLTITLPLIHGCTLHKYE